MYLSILLDHATALLFSGYSARHASYNIYLNYLTEP
jgi:hypothetical protein